MLINIATIKPINAAEAYELHLLKSFLVTVPKMAITTKTVADATKAEAISCPVYVPAIKAKVTP